MGIAVKKNNVVIDEENLDIYTADRLKETLLELVGKGKTKVVLDMKKVERVTTPALQVILSAKKTFEEVQVKSLNKAVNEDLARFGVTL